MENMFITPAALWKGYDPASLPLAVNIIREEHFKDAGYTVREVYFNGGNSLDGSVRGYGRFVFKDQKPKPAILILGSAGHVTSINDYTAYLDAGYNVFLLDYSGDTGKAGRFTLYPQSRAFSNFLLNKNNIYEASSGAQNTCWYDWTVLATRAITLLISFFEVISSAIMVHGEKEGGALAWIMASVDSRIAGSIALFEAGWNNYTAKEQDEDGSHAAWQAALSPQAYAQSVKKPILFLGASNEKGAAFERINDTFMRIPADIPSYISVAPRLSGQLIMKNFNTGLMFIKQCITGEDIFPKRPVIEARASENKLYYGIKADKHQDIKKIKIYCASNESNPEIRNWAIVPSESVGDGEFLAKADLYNSHTNIYAFANIEYKNGVLLSTATLARLPSALGIESRTVIRNRLFYDSSMGVDSFFAVTDGLINSGVTIADGPVGLIGVTAKEGAIATYKTNDIRFKGEDTNAIQFTVYAKEAVTMTLVAEERTEGKTKRFRSIKALSGTQFWQKITVSLNDLKSREGAALSGWNNIVMLLIDGKGIIINSILWV